ncbi:hypothetical protein L1049_019244 [Liquidambar formosana]|uniref:Uncharacterized protein n=1 Tax=Liquidambar formosana TaxID=63359 RepID=A0AAP0RB92_LIQFO
MLLFFFFWSCYVLGPLEMNAITDEPIKPKSETPPLGFAISDLTRQILTSTLTMASFRSSLGAEHRSEIVNHGRGFVIGGFCIRRRRLQKGSNSDGGLILNVDGVTDEDEKKGGEWWRKMRFYMDLPWMRR